jgi:threonylcarbamoyladenosine tRNA methylthiotransferase MtaB
VELGGKEVVLTGINLGAWGTETSNDFASGKLPLLVDRILKETSIARLRISSLGVEFVSDALIERLKNPRIHAYVHLSVQSGSDRILAAMGRHYNRATLLDRLHKLRTLMREDGVQIQIGADLIVGFPSESDADFADTLSLVQEF